MLKKKVLKSCLNLNYSCSNKKLAEYWLAHFEKKLHPDIDWKQTFLRLASRKQTKMRVKLGQVWNIMCQSSLRCVVNGTLYRIFPGILRFKV